MAARRSSSEKNPKIHSNNSKSSEVNIVTTKRTNAKCLRSIPNEKEEPRHLSYSEQYTKTREEHAPYRVVSKEVELDALNRKYIGTYNILIDYLLCNTSIQLVQSGY
ncbi:uncharacterized protein LOC132933820 [Metopolophium dirhodum]|uniref:uncharacterized protein LOC132933820 n=1 Tax=Metopolophium dirhodum TaxID=44670 RepID=UPI00298FB3B5|nr:uncharacterized protein LOC132933820 [Metopolophium dirhodum]